MKTVARILLISLTLLLVAGCSKPAIFDWGEAITEAEETVRQLDGVQAVASAFDGSAVRLKILTEEPVPAAMAEELADAYMEVLSGQTDGQVPERYPISYSVHDTEGNLLAEGQEE